MGVALDLDDDQRAELLVVARSGMERARKVRQAGVLLALADGRSVREIERTTGPTSKTVLAWRDAYLAKGIASIGVIGDGRGRRPTHDDETVAAIVHDTLHALPDDDSQSWSTRTLADRHGVSKDFVARVWRKRRLRPWRRDTFKVSNDTNFEAKLIDIIGLYLDPPVNAAVWCYDEKTQCQALDRTQPSLPMIPGRCATLTHDYKRNGTSDLFAALNVATGQVVHDQRRTHNGNDVLSFFKSLDEHVPRDLEVHVILDNLSTHKSEPVREWLAKPAQKRWHLHFTPTSASWLNLVECWFSVLTRKRLKNSSFRNVLELRTAIDSWVEHWNDNPTPFIWKRTADEIIDAVNRARTTLRTVGVKSATDH